MNKLLIICGPTATGKTDLGIRLAKKFGGEIVSADSRQAYRGMDVITGKDIEENSKLIRQLADQNSKLNITNDKLSAGYRLKDGIPVWMVDIVEPDYVFSSGEFAQVAQKVIKDIWERERLPIIVGGTGFYIRSIINPYETYMIPPNKVLRKKLESMPLSALQGKLRVEDLGRWEDMNESDKQNPRRLIRAIEVVDWKKSFSQKSPVTMVIAKENILMIGLRGDFKNILRQRIIKRIEQRLKSGAIDEVKKLMEKKYSWFLPAFTATGASEIKKFIEGKQTISETIRSWEIREADYAKKQITYFNKALRQAGGKWFDISDPDYPLKIEERVGKWYTQG